jgi:hypothetical protein
MVAVLPRVLLGLFKVAEAAPLVRASQTCVVGVQVPLSVHSVVSLRGPRLVPAVSKVVVR